MAGRVRLVNKANWSRAKLNFMALRVGARHTQWQPGSSGVDPTLPLAAKPNQFGFDIIYASRRGVGVGACTSLVTPACYPGAPGTHYRQADVL